MGATGDRVIAARLSYPDTLVPNERAELRLGLVRDGVPVIPSPGFGGPGGWELLDPAGQVLKSGDLLIDGDGRLAFDLSAFDTYDLEVGQLYQIRWYPAFELGDVRTFRTEAVVAPIRLVPPVADADLTVGNYPDLVELVGGFAATGANGENTLQPYIDEAWAWFLRRLFKVGRWPDLLVSTHDAVDVVRDRAWYLVFRFLFRSQGGDATRFEVLMRDHEKAAEREWSSLSARWDFNRDGLADGEDREPGPAALHINGAPRRRLSRSSRW
jgi:hypothetical protein